MKKPLFSTLTTSFILATFPLLLLTLFSCGNKQVKQEPVKQYKNFTTATNNKEMLFDAVHTIGTYFSINKKYMGDVKYYTSEDFTTPDELVLPIRFLSNEGVSYLELLKGEILAKHHYKFKQPVYQTIFNFTSWYDQLKAKKGLYDEKSLNASEKENVRRLGLVISGERPETWWDENEIQERAAKKMSLDIMRKIPGVWAKVTFSSNDLYNAKIQYSSDYPLDKEGRMNLDISLYGTEKDLLSESEKIRKEIEEAEENSMNKQIQSAEEKRLAWLKNKQNQLLEDFSLIMDYASIKEGEWVINKEGYKKQVIKEYPMGTRLKFDKPYTTSSGKVLTESAGPVCEWEGGLKYLQFDAEGNSLPFGVSSYMPTIVDSGQTGIFPENPEGTGNILGLGRSFDGKLIFFMLENLFTLSLSDNFTYESGWRYAYEWIDGKKEERYQIKIMPYSINNIYWYMPKKQNDIIFIEEKINLYDRTRIYSKKYNYYFNPDSPGYFGGNDNKKNQDLDKREGWSKGAGGSIDEMGNIYQNFRILDEKKVTIGNGYLLCGNISFLSNVTLVRNQPGYFLKRTDQKYRIWDYTVQDIVWYPGIISRNNQDAFDPVYNYQKNILHVDVYKAYSKQKRHSFKLDLGSYFRKGGEHIYKCRYLGEDDNTNLYFELRVGHKDILYLNYKVILKVNLKGEILLLGRFQTFRSLIWESDKMKLIDSHSLYQSYVEVSGYNNTYYDYYLKKIKEEKHQTLEKGHTIAVGQVYHFYYGYDLDWDGNIYVLYNGMESIYLDKWGK